MEPMEPAVASTPSVTPAPESPRRPTHNNTVALASDHPDTVLDLLSDGESDDDVPDAITTAAIANSTGGVTDSASRTPSATNSQQTARLINPDESLENFPKHFESWDEFEAYMSEFCALTYQPFRKRSSVAVTRRNTIIAEQNNGGKPLPEGFQFYSMRFQCTHGRMPVHRGGGLRVRTALRHTGCTARLNATLKMDDRSQRYVVETRLSDAHNHPIGKEHYSAYSENRQISDPALLRVIEVMKARGESGKAILTRMKEIVRDTTGEESMLNIKDIHNTVARLRKARRIASQGSGGAQDEAATAGDQSVDEASNSDSDNVGTGERHKKRRIDWARVDAAVSAQTDITDFVFEKTKKPYIKVALSHLGVLLDASNCYNHIQNEVAQVGIAKVELLVGTLSGFQHEILTLSASTKPEDVDFVLPHYVLNGCERYIIKYCGKEKVQVPEVGVKLVVLDPRTDEPRTVTLGSRQLLTMKRFYLARQNVAGAKIAIDWVTASTKLEDCQVVAPFNEYTDYSKDLMLLSLGLLPFSGVIVGGVSIGAQNVPMRFTDTIIGANLFKFVRTDSNLDVDCVKAALLGLHSRFYTTAAFLSPSFMHEKLIAERCKQGSGYGAFLAPKRFVAGMVQLRSARWGGVVLDCLRNACFLFTTDAAEYPELQQVVSSLLTGFSLPGVEFVVLPPPREANVSPLLLKEKSNSGVFALLVIELALQSKEWVDLGKVEFLDYYRMRYLLQAAQVVTKQNIHEIRWT